MASAASAVSVSACTSVTLPSRKRQTWTHGSFTSLPVSLPLASLWLSTTTVSPDAMNSSGAERLPVVAELGELLLHGILPLGHTVVRHLRRLRVLPTNVVGEVLCRAVEVSAGERLVTLAQRVCVGHVSSS